MTKFIDYLRGGKRKKASFPSKSIDTDPPLYSWIRKKQHELENYPFTFNPSIISYIVIHHSLTSDGQTVDWEAIRKFHMEQRGWRDIGYHFGVEEVKDDYQVMQGRNLDIRGAHVKDGGFNRNSIGICMVGNFDKSPPSLKQWSLGVLLVRRLIDFYEEKNNKIFPQNIIGHWEAQEMAGLPPLQRKSCPGIFFDMDKFREEIKHPFWESHA